MSEKPHATLTEDEGILTVTIDRQEKRNAISPQVTQTLWDAVDRLGERPDLRCMVITAVGPYFSAGIDLAAFRHDQENRPDYWNEHATWYHRRRYRRHHALYDEFEATEKPVVLAAQGTCLGAGTEMAVSCDFRFCTPETEFALPEVKLGVVSGSGGSSRLTRLIGVPWAKYIAMAGMPVGAEKALAIGLVHDVFPAESFLDDVYAFCRKMIEIPSDALGTAKLAVDMAGDIADRNAIRHFDRVANFSLMESDLFKRRADKFFKK
jgi:enoyl-CoA hydratase